jgi:8-oxo-dGTP diphosphatase
VTPGRSETVVIVAAAIVDGGPPRVLAAQRSYPADLAGLWELPGGKVQPGERDVDALVRECREELGVEVALGARLGADVAIAPTMVLRVWWARPVAGVPTALEHRALRWLAREHLDDVPWLPSDAPVLAALRAAWPVRSGR